MFSNRLVSLILMTLLVLGRTVTAETLESDKFRALLDTGESVVLKSARLTSDSLIGTSGYGTRSIPVQSLRSLDRSTGTHGATMGMIVGGLGFAYILADLLQADATTHFYSAEIDQEDRDAFDLALYTAGGAILGIAIGSCFEKWQSVPLGGSVSYRPEQREVRFQLSLSI